MGKRISQIGNIRAVIIFIVVLAHSIILYSSEWGLYQTMVSVPLLDGLFQAIVIVVMPLFFSLSGYLFVFTHKKKQGIINLLKSKVLRLLVPYVGVGSCFMLPIRIGVGFPSYREMRIVDFLLKLLTSSDVGHLWFLPALFLVFMLSEIILTVVEKIPGIRKYPEAALCAIGGVLYLEGYRIGFGYPPLLNAFNYLLWFGFGYFLNVHQVVLRKLYRIPGLKWILLALNAILAVYCLRVDYVRVMIALGIKGLCIVNAYGAMPEKSCKLLEKIDRNSFGIYLFHSPLIYITFANIPNAHPVIVVFINLVVFGAVAYGLTELTRRTKLKVLIGE